MGLIGRVRLWVHTAALTGRAEREMQQEMAEHIRRATERYAARGMTQRQAGLAARREFGSVALVQDQARDAWGARGLDTLMRDCRFALRQFARAPITTLIIVFTLMLGIGVNSALFSALQATLFRPPAGVPDDPSLVLLRGIDQSSAAPSGRFLSFPEVAAYQALDSLFTGVTGWTLDGVVVSFDGNSAAQPGAGLFVTPNYFAVLGVPLTAGAGFTDTRFDPQDDAELTAVLNYDWALSQFGTAQAAIGHRLRVNDVPVTIVGVAPQRFRGFTPGSGHVAWMPISALPAIGKRNAHDAVGNDAAKFEAAARLAIHASITSVGAPLRVVAARAAQAQRAVRPPRWSADAVRIRGNINVRGFRGQDYAIMSIAVLLATIILLLCTTTVSALLAGAAVARRQEISVRLAMGASRARIVRQLIVESALLAGAGGICGLVLLIAIQHAFDADHAPLDWPTVAITAVFAVGSALLSGLSPALHAVRHGLADVLKDSATGVMARSRLQRTFVVSQIALTQPLLVALAMVVLMGLRALAPPPGSAVQDRVIEARFNTWRGSLDGGDGNDSYLMLARRLAAVPGVKGVLRVSNATGQFELFVDQPGKPGQLRTIQAATQAVDPEYFTLLEIPFVRGRSFRMDDRAPSTHTIIIGSDLAASLFGATDPIGRRLSTDPSRGSARGYREWEIVGVVDARYAGSSARGVRQRIFVPFRGDVLADGLIDGYGPMLIRTEGPAAPLLNTIRAVSRSDAPLLPLMSMQTLAAKAAAERRELLRTSAAVAGAGMLTLFLASVGLFAMVALAVNQRKREIGLRVALGARPGQVVGLFFQGGLRLTALGLAIGLALSVAAMWAFAAQVGLPTAGIPIMTATVAAIVLGVASLATWLPARRAAGLDPLAALRVE